MEKHTIYFDRHFFFPFLGGSVCSLCSFLDWWKITANKQRAGMCTLTFGCIHRAMTIKES